MVQKVKKYPHAFFEKKSWYHRTKELLDDYSVKYGKKGGFKSAKEAEEAYVQHIRKFEQQMNKTFLVQDKDITFRNYLIYWYESIFSERIKSMTRYLAAYVVYGFLLPNIDEKMLLKFVSTDYLNELLEKVSKYCESSGNKSREMLFIAMHDAIIFRLIENNPVKATKRYPRAKRRIQILNKTQIRCLLLAARERNWFLEILLALYCGLRKGDADGKISLNQQKPSKHAGLRRFGPGKFLQRNNEFMKERPIFYKKPIKTEKDFSTWLRCFYYTTKAVITEYIYF